MLDAEAAADATDCQQVDFLYAYRYSVVLPHWNVDAQDKY